MKYLYTALFLCTLSLSATNWSTPTIIDSGAIQVNDLIFTCYIPSTNQIFASWGSYPSPYHPTYSIASYINGAWVWTTPNFIDTSTSKKVQDNLFLCFASETNQIFASWGLLPSPCHPFYSIASYANGSWTWSLPAVLNTESTSPADFNVSICYAAATNQVFAAWGDNNHPYYPTYSVASYVNGDWVWSPATVFDITSTSSVEDAIFICYAPSTNQIFASWSDYTNHHYYPTYSIGSFINSTWVWSSPNVISTLIPTYTDFYGDNVFTCYIPPTNQVFTTWTNQDPPYLPYYSTYLVGKGASNGIHTGGTSGKGTSSLGSSGTGTP